MRAGGGTASGRGMGDSSKITGSFMRVNGLTTDLMALGVLGIHQNQVKRNAMCSLAPSKCPKDMTSARCLNRRAESCTMAPGPTTICRGELL